MHMNFFTHQSPMRVKVQYHGTLFYQAQYIAKEISIFSVYNHIQTRLVICKDHNHSFSSLVISVPDFPWLTTCYPHSFQTYHLIEIGHLFSLEVDTVFFPVISQNFLFCDIQMLDTILWPGNIAMPKENIPSFKELRYGRKTINIDKEINFKSWQIL